MKQARKRAVELLKKMTLEEKIGQTVQYGRYDDYRRELIAAGRVGSMLNVYGAERINELQKIAIEKTRLGIPLLIGDDVIHGYRTIFPIPLAEAASWNLESMEKNARIAAIEAASEGIRWTFAPMVDVTREARWGRIAEGAGEDVYLGSLAAEARVKGFQQANAEGYPTLAACVKHFAGYGWVEGGRDYDTTDMSERTLREHVLPPFLAGIQAGAMSVMTAFNEVSGVPASGNVFLLRDILRNEWGYEGITVSDWESIEELIYHGYAEDRRDAAFKGMRAGVDMDMHSGVYQEHLVSIIEERPEVLKLLDEAVLRILTIKYALGLFENPYTDVRQHEKLILAPEHLEQARLSASQSVVLLKNNPGILPLDFTKQRKIALIGPLADDHHHTMGCWSHKGREEDVQTVRDAFNEELTPFAEIVYEKGSEVKGELEGGLERAVKLASLSDIAIVVVGESEDMTGEHYNRTVINLPECQERLIREIKSCTNTPVVVVLMNGRPLAIEWVQENADAIVEAWHPGTRGGGGIIDVLTGKYNPSGRLPVTFPRATGQIPIYYNRKSTGRPFLYEDYLDCDDDELYPFGFGLSYTTFTYSDLSLDRTSIKVDEEIKVSAKVTNTGTRVGEETVQLYIRDWVGSTTRPVKELKGYRKLLLQPGESAEVQFTLTSVELGMLDEKLDFTVEPGKFTVWIGPHSGEGLAAEFFVV